MCRFIQRVPDTRPHSKFAFRDEKYSYVAIQKVSHSAPTDVREAINPESLVSGLGESSKFSRLVRTPLKAKVITGDDQVAQLLLLSHRATSISMYANLMDLLSERPCLIASNLRCFLLHERWEPDE